MDKKLHFKSLLLIVALLLGGGNSAWADEAVFTFNTDAGIAALGLSKPNASAGTNLNTTEAYVISGVSMTVTSGNTATRIWNSNGNLDLRIYSGGTFTFLPPTGNNITKIVLAGNTVGGFSCGDNGTFSNGTWEGSSNSVVLTATATEKINTITVTYESASDTRTATTVIISGHETPLYVGDSPATPTATVKAGDDAIDGTVVTWSSSEEGVATINEETGAITLVGAGTTTITASYAGNSSYKPSEASYTLSVGKVFTSIQAMQKGLTNTSNEPIKVTITDATVTHVYKSNAYIIDADGYGAVIYKNDHGLIAGKLLNGTVKCNGRKNAGRIQIDGVPADVTDGSLTIENKTIADITTANQSMLVKLTGVNCKKSDDDFFFHDPNDDTKKIQYFNQFGLANNILSDNATYDITGIVIIYNGAIEIAPRTADDIVSYKEDPTGTWKSGETAITSSTIALSDGAKQITFETNGGNVTFTSEDETIATVSGSGSIATVTPQKYGLTTIKAHVEATATYNEKDFKISIIVCGDIEDGIFDFTTYQDYGSGMIPTSANEYVYDEKTWTAGDVTLKTNGKTRWFKADKSSLRLYYNDPNPTMTISVPSGYKIVNISGLSTKEKFTANKGTKSSSTWTGREQEVTFTYTATSDNASMNKLVVIYLPESDLDNISITTTGEYTTFCSPFQIAIDKDDTGITVYRAAEKDGVVKLSAFKDNIVPANAGVILGGEAKTFTASVAETSPSNNGNDLIGVLEDTAVPWSVVEGESTKYNYILQGGEFKMATGDKLKAGRAYLKTSYNVEDAGSARLTIVVGGETTGIKTVKGDSDEQSVYDLQGRKVAQPAKGLYITNGKKFIVK